MKQLKYYKNQLTYADIGIKDKRKKINDEILETMKQLRKQNISYQKIANQLNVSYNFVYFNLNRDYYENKFKKIQERHYKKLKANNKIIKTHNRYKKYNEQRKRIFNSIDYKMYLSPRPEKNTIKKQILDFLTEDREYTYSEIKNHINKDYAIFSAVLKRLDKEGKVKIGGVVHARTVRKIK